MANLIQLKRSATAGSTQLADGELAVALTPQTLYTKNPGGGNSLIGTPHSADAATFVAAANYAAMRTALGVDAAGTDNSTDVTLGGSLDYLTISGQVITRNAINLSTDVTGNLPPSNLNGGTGATSTSFWRGDGVWATPAGSGNVSTSGSPAVDQIPVFANGTDIEGTADFTYTSATTTGDQFSLLGNSSITAGNVAFMYNDNAAHTGQVLHIWQDNASATSRPLLITQDGDAEAIDVDHNGDSSIGIRVIASGTTASAGLFNTTAASPGITLEVTNTNSASSNTAFQVVQSGSGETALIRNLNTGSVSSVLDIDMRGSGDAVVLRDNSAPRFALNHLGRISYYDSAAIPAAGQVMRSDGSEIRIAAIVAGDLPDLSGTYLTPAAGNAAYEPLDSTIIKEGELNVSTTLAAAANTTAPSSLAVKTYVDNEVAGALASEMTYRGGYNASTNSPDLDTSPSGISIGDTYTVTTAGTFFSASVQAGDLLISEVNNPTLEADWTIVNQNIGDLADLSLDGGTWT